MVKHWYTSRESGWRWRAMVNAFGGILTAVVLAVVVSVKFVHGAWLVVVLIPIEVGLFLFVHRQYAASREHLALRQDQVLAPPRRPNRVVIPVSTINRSTAQAVNVGRAISSDVRGVLVTEDPDQAERLRDEWSHHIPGVPLVIVESPFRALVGPFLAYLDVLDQSWPPDREAPVTFVVVPEYVARHWWERILYGQSANRLRRALVGRPNTVVTNVPYRREEPEAFRRGTARATESAKVRDATNR